MVYVIAVCLCTCAAKPISIPQNSLEPSPISAADQRKNKATDMIQENINEHSSQDGLSMKSDEERVKW